MPVYSGIVILDGGNGVAETAVGGDDEVVATGNVQKGAILIRPGVDGALFDLQRTDRARLQTEHERSRLVQVGVAVIDGKLELAELQHCWNQNKSFPNTTAAIMPTKSAESPATSAWRILRMPTEPK